MVATVTYLKQRAASPWRPAILCWVCRVRPTSPGNDRRQGAAPCSVTPKAHCLLPEERAAIVAYKRQHPALGYRRLAYMMLDEGLVAVPPSSVYRVLRDAGLATCWTQAPGRHSKQGFDQPQRTHEQWHTDIAYLNILGTVYWWIGRLDNYSRASLITRFVWI